MSSKSKIPYRYFDYCLGSWVRFDSLSEPFLQPRPVIFGHVVLPYALARAALYIHARRSRKPAPPLPHLAQLVFEPRQLQHFLRGCVLFTACRLVIEGGSMWRYDQSRNSCWVHFIFVRVLSGVVKRVQVLRCGVICACARRC